MCDLWALVALTLYATQEIEILTRAAENWGEKARRTLDG